MLSCWGRFAYKYCLLQDYVEREAVGGHSLPRLLQPNQVQAQVSWEAAGVRKPLVIVHDGPCPVCRKHAHTCDEVIDIYVLCV